MIPEKLSKGDVIGVITPSDPFSHDLEDRLQTGCSYLRSLGFDIKLGRHLRSNQLGFAASPQEKAEDINSMFADPDIKAIICAQGGETANTSLPFLDWDMIQQNPKVFLGLSDITVLLNAITHKTGLVTFHGNDILWGFGLELSKYEQEEFLRLLVRGEIGPIPPNRERQTIRRGHAQGILLGGNLSCLLKLAGTSYWPDFTGSIFFVEAYEISAKTCHTAFHQLKQMGFFDQISGAVVGYIDSMQRKDTPRPHMEDVLLEVTQDYDFPILKINDFGHNCPNTVLPVGCEAIMDAGKQTLEVSLPCVKG